MEYDIASDERVSRAVVRAVSAIRGREPSTLDPLSGVLDPAALDALFAPGEDGTPRTGGRLSFVYDGCRITVDNGEYLTLRPMEPLVDRAPDVVDR